MIETAVSGAAGGICAGGAALLYLADKLPGLNKVTAKLHTDRIQVVLILTAAAAMISTPAGAWWNRTVNTVNDWAVGLVGDWTGLLVTGIPALAVLLYLINDLVSNTIKMRTRIMAALLPVLVASIPGGIGTVIQSVLSGLVSFVGRLVAGAFGVA